MLNKIKVGLNVNRYPGLSEAKITDNNIVLHDIPGTSYRK